jgi:hypothetical protein
MSRIAACGRCRHENGRSIPEPAVRPRTSWLAPRAPAVLPPLVMGATMTVRKCGFISSGETMRQGRDLRVSLPRVGSRSTWWTSKRDTLSLRATPTPWCRTQSASQGRVERRPRVGGHDRHGAGEGSSDPRTRGSRNSSGDCSRSRTGLILIRAGLYDNVIRLLPPLVTTDRELDEGLDILCAARCS